MPTHQPTPRPPAHHTPRRVTVDVHGIAHGGEAVGRLPDDKAVFIAHAIPGERVVVDLFEDRKRWARGRLVEVLEASPDRVEPPCPYAGAEPVDAEGRVTEARCGGCALQHVAPARQASWKHQVVVDALERIGKVVHPPVEEMRTPRTLGYRNRARFGVDPEGRLGFHRQRSDDIVPIDTCLLLTDRTQATREAAGDDWEGCDEVVVRAASSTEGEGAALLANVGPDQPGVTDLPDIEAGIALISTDGEAVELRAPTTLVEVIAGHRLQVSAASFFQASTAAAELMADLVVEAAAVTPGDVVVDAYSGVGLFARVLAAAGATVHAIEGDPSAVADAQVNLADVDATVHAGEVGAVTRDMVEAGQRADVVVLDPPRRGIEAAALSALIGLEPERIVYVSCDPASFARDVARLADARYRLERVVPIDQFAQTAHVELVATLRHA